MSVHASRAEFGSRWRPVAEEEEEDVRGADALLRPRRRRGRGQSSESAGIGLTGPGFSRVATLAPPKVISHVPSGAKSWAR